MPRRNSKSAKKIKDIRQAKEWSEYLKSQGWKVEKLKTEKPKVTTYAYIRKIPLVGSVVKIQRPQTLPPLKEIDRVAQKHKALFVKVEPFNRKQYKKLEKEGFKPAPLPNLPTKTLIVDLGKTKKELWSNLSQDARQSVRKAQENKLEFINKKPEDKEFEKRLIQFHALLKETGKRQKFWTPSLNQLKEKVKTFKKDVNLFLVLTKKGKPVAGALTLKHDGTHSASSSLGQKLYASYLLLWEIILHFQKAKRFPYHDLSGIYDPRFQQATKRWKGFTAFKRKFGGEEKEYPPPLIKHYNPVAKLAFKIGEIMRTYL